jgi:hypothetical protein
VYECGRCDERVPDGSRVGEMQYSAAQGDRGVDREDSFGEGRQYLCFKPATEDRAL